MLVSSTIQMYKFGQKIKNHSTPSLILRETFAGCSEMQYACWLPVVGFKCASSHSLWSLIYLHTYILHTGMTEVTTDTTDNTDCNDRLVAVGGIGNYAVTCANISQ